MDPRDEPTPEGDISEERITQQDVERIANPLTVVYGYTELLQRRVRRGQHVDEKEVLRVLDIISGSSRSIREGLTLLKAKIRKNESDSARNQAGPNR